ncbi:GntP family gluconate:H+ symporter [Methanofollis sp. W23]|nr:GntP family gluconate:H+ symporter [Methanofollis sp. W23]
MQTFVAFLVVLLLIAVATVRFRLNPFLTLFSAAVVYGLLAGVPAGAVVGTAAAGAGKVFVLLGVVVFAGSVVAGVLKMPGYREQIVRDLSLLFKRPTWVGAVTGAVLAVPFMCCMTAFIVASPILSCLSDRKRALYAAAIGSTLSFALVYPTPVTLAASAAAPAFSAGEYLLVALPLALLLLIGVSTLMGRGGSPAISPSRVQTVGRRAWVPLALPLACAAAGLIWPVFGDGSVQAALLFGMAGALLLLTAEERHAALKWGTRHAGVIIYDLCGAGALGGVILASTFPQDTFGLLDGVVPLLLLPLVFAVLVQAAQGSRVVTAVVTAGVVASLPLHPVALVLLIAAGTLSVSAFSDPYFWLVGRTTEDPPMAVLRHYTLPLMGVSLCVAGAGALAGVLL